MKKTITALTTVAALLLVNLPCMAFGGTVSVNEKYLFAGKTDDYYTEEAFRSSPIVTDLDNDGRPEVINVACSVVVMDAATGKEKWRVNSGKDRTSVYDNLGNIAGPAFTDMEIADIDLDGRKEIVVGYRDGSISVLDDQGYFKPGWPQQPINYSVRSLAVDDVSGDGKLEIITGYGVPSSVSVWVYNCDGTIANGWPQLTGMQDALINPEVYGNAYSYGVFGDGITTCDLDDDGKADIIVPTDTAYIPAYHGDGTLVQASPIYGGRTWGKIALYEDYAQEIACVNEGWGFEITGEETRAELYRAELGHSAAVCSDVDGDGISEIAVTALMIDRTDAVTNRINAEETKYMTVFLLNKDRSRYINKSLGFDWSASPRDLGGSIKGFDADSMPANVFSEPVCADLDMDGYQEILFNSYNGKMHCFSLDGKEHGAWPFVLPKTTETVFEYASPPACVDINGDGNKEVIFASWTDNADSTNTGVNGSLYVLDHNGNLLSSKELHDGYATYEGVIFDQNGVKSAPVVADVDGNGNFEVFLNTTFYALCVYELETEKVAPTAHASSQTVQVDNTKIDFPMYALVDDNGNLTNYIRIRDLANYLNNTPAQFSVGYDGKVSLTKGMSYIPQGSEGNTPFSGNRTCTILDDTTLINFADGRSSLDVDLISIRLTDDNGGGYTYYKLRDVGRCLGFNVGWSADRGVFIETDKPYNAND